MNTHILISIEDVKERIADLKRQSANAKKAKCTKDVEQIAFEIAAIEETLRKGKQISLDDKDIEIASDKAYPQTIFNMGDYRARKGYKQALNDLKNNSCTFHTLTIVSPLITH